MKIDWLLIYVSLLYNGIRYIDDPKTRSKPEDSSLDKEVMGVLHDNSLHYDSGLRSLDIKLEEKEKNSLILKTFKTCVATEGDTETQLKIRNKYCFGWN